MSVRDLKGGLKNAKIGKDEIKIVVHNLQKLIKSDKLDKDKIGIVVHNLVASAAFRAKFNKDPKGSLVGINPVPSP
jgi:hypothetical protein